VALLPPPQLRTLMFARHSLRIATQNRASERFEGREFWRPRASGPPRNYVGMSTFCRWATGKFLFLNSTENTQLSDKMLLTKCSYEASKP